MRKKRTIVGDHRVRGTSIAVTQHETINTRGRADSFGSNSVSLGVCGSGPNHMGSPRSTSWEVVEAPLPRAMSASLGLAFHRSDTADSPGNASSRALPPCESAIIDNDRHWVSTSRDNADVRLLPEGLQKSLRGSTCKQQRSAVYLLTRNRANVRPPTPFSQTGRNDTSWCTCSRTRARSTSGTGVAASGGLRGLNEGGAHHSGDPPRP